MDIERGAISPCTSTYIAGWTSRDALPPPSVLIRVNGEAVGKVTPWLPRPDVLAALGLVYARGFFFSFPKRLAHGDRVEALNESGGHLQGSPAEYLIPSLPTDLGFAATRAAIAAMFLRGAGLEIGAFTQPTDLPAGASIEYYDRFPAAKLREFYDETWGRPLVEPSYFGDAQLLDGLPPGRAFDFVIANHVIEHFEDPIAFLRRLPEVLRPAGRVLLIAPNKRFTFDRGRELTRFEHLIDDHRGGARRNRSGHYAEWVATVDKLSGEAASQRAKQLEADGFSIHFHVWDENAFLSFVSAAIQEFNLPLSLMFAYNAHHEIAVVLEKL